MSPSEWHRYRFSCWKNDHELPTRYLAEETAGWV